MNCLFIYRWCTLGGVETSIINKMEALQQEKIDCQAILDYDDNKKLYAKYPNMMMGLSKSERLRVLKKNYDFIIFIDYPNFFNLVKDISINSKFILETHSSYLPSLESYYKEINSRLSAVVVPSQFNKRLVERYSKTKQRVLVIPNPINQELFRNKPVKGKRKKVIIWVGRWDPGKNLIEFIKIANQLLKRNSKLHFIIVGDAYGRNYHDYKNNLEAQIENGHQADFTFYQKIPYHNMPYIYSLSANTGGCLVCTSRYESLPMTLVEAMACKCPVVATGVGGIGELISDNITGKLYQPGNLKSAIGAILDLVDEEKKDFRERIINNAFTKANKIHSFSVVGPKYKKLLLGL